VSAAASPVNAHIPHADHPTIPPLISVPSRTARATLAEAIKRVDGQPVG
jgi:hypothetical protein